MGETYRVVRFFQDRATPRRVIKTGLTLDEAQDHCNDPETSSRTCTTSAGVEELRRNGPWFDGYERE